MWPVYSFTLPPWLTVQCADIAAICLVSLGCNIMCFSVYFHHAQDKLSQTACTSIVETTKTEIIEYQDQDKDFEGLTKTRP